MRMRGMTSAFTSPTKFVGPVYDEAQARKLAAERGWNIRQDGQEWLAAALWVGGAPVAACMRGE